MAIFRISSSFDDDVGMILKEGDHLFRCGNLLSLEDPPVGLIDDLLEDTDRPFDPSGQFTPRKGIREV